MMTYEPPPSSAIPVKEKLVKCSSRECFFASEINPRRLAVLHLKKSVGRKGIRRTFEQTRKMEKMRSRV